MAIGVRKLDFSGYQFLKECAEEVLETDSLFGCQVFLPIGRRKCIRNFDLLFQRRQWDKPRFEELDVDVLLRAFRSEAVHLRLLGNEVVVEERSLRILIGRNAHEAIRTCRVKLQYSGKADICGNWISIVPAGNILLIERPSSLRVWVNERMVPSQLETSPVWTNGYSPP